MTPTDIRLHKKAAVLELKYADGGLYSLPAEFLRVYSPSAEVQGHGPGQEVLQVEKKHVTIENLEMVGNYALKLHFSDGHNTGLYTWEYLRKLSLEQPEMWQRYLNRLSAANARREPLPEDTQPVRIIDFPKNN
jgi:DUF971 family protein